MEKIKTWLQKPRKDEEDGIQPLTSLWPGLSSQRATQPAGQSRHFVPDSHQSATSSPQLPARPLLSLRSDCSLLSSPSPGVRRRAACSLPCSPLLGKASRGSSPCPPAAVSRLWVEAALQRSKNTRQVEPRSLAPCSQKDGSDDDDDEEEDEEEGAEPLCSDADRWRYCLLTPCVCFRCPSAPPLEDQHLVAELAPARGLQVDVHGSPRGGAPRPAELPQLYPSLSAWKSPADAQDQLSGRHQEEVNNPMKRSSPHSCFYGNGGEDPGVRTPAESRMDVNLGCPHPSSVSGASGDRDQSCFLQGAPEVTSCCLRKALPAESCSFCADDCGVKLSPRQGGCCGSQVLCCRCLSCLVSWLQISQLAVV